ncbi:MAG: pseudouridine synthase [Alphaproteobacteria bacterium]|nr:pseudouridine synthase [Alphaproteobacteria bacterium]
MKNGAKKHVAKEPAEKKFEGERVAKFLARAGVCSRRDAEKLILAGRVAVDGIALKSPAQNITAQNKVTVDGNAVGDPEVTRVWRYHKPAGLVTTSRDPKGRPTVFDKLPHGLPRVVSVGRLDLTTEGLLLLTNDGELARHLELPQNAWLRHYRVRVFGRVDEKRLRLLGKGVRIAGMRYGPIRAELEDKIADGANSWISVSITEGKNREVRKVMEYLGLKVTRLIRTSFGPFQLAKLPRGEVEEVPRRVLKEQLANFFKDKGR